MMMHLFIYSKGLRNLLQKHRGAESHICGRRTACEMFYSCFPLLAAGLHHPVKGSSGQEHYLFSLQIQIKEDKCESLFFNRVFSGGQFQNGLFLVSSLFFVCSARLLMRAISYIWMSFHLLKLEVPNMSQSIQMRALV